MGKRSTGHGGIAVIRKVMQIYGRFRPFLVKLRDDNVYAIAGQSAFYFLLAIVPLMMFAVSILQNLHIPQETLEDFLKSILNETAAGELSSFLSNMYNDYSGMSVITLIVTLWSAAQGMHAITNGLNRVHNTHENRNWFILRIRAMFITLVLVALIFAALAVFVLGSTLNDLIMPFMQDMPGYLLNLYALRYLLVYVYLVLIFALMYNRVPNLKKKDRKQYGLVNQLPGAILSATAWFVLSLGISIYVDDFNGFSIYGGLTRVAVLMIWLYWCLLSIMFGAEINVYYHNKIINMRKKRLVRRTIKKVLHFNKKKKGKVRKKTDSLPGKTGNDRIDGQRSG